MSQNNEKMKTTIITIIGIACLGVAHAQNQNDAIVSSNSFALDLYKYLSKNEKGNIFISPYSISIAMGMTYAGANGETQAEMSKVLYFPLNDKGFHKDFGKTQKLLLNSGSKGVEISLANKLWADKQYKFKCSFTRGVRKNYNAPLVRMDFRNSPEPSRLEINGWVEQQTKSRIKELLPNGAITDLTALVLTNAIYFKGQWDNKFSPENTRSDAFFPSATDKVPCQFMNREGKYQYAKTENFSALEIPYAGKEFSMLVLLPHDGIELEEVEKNLSLETITLLAVNMDEFDVRVSFPKFKFENKYELKPMLSSLGMPTAFSNRADFTRMSKKPDLKIDEVYHKAFVEVSEEGTEAAAATAVVIVRKAMPMFVDFNANRPFLFFIRHRETGAIVFVGRMTNPN